jgi:hypothetical protein
MTVFSRVNSSRASAHAYYSLLITGNQIICELVIKHDVYDYGFDYYQAYY